MPHFDPDRPARYLEVDLCAWGEGLSPAPGAVRLRDWEHPDPLWARVGSWSGSALGLALWQRHRERAPFVICVGEAVRRGLPTAARASLIARAPLDGRLVEGQVGSDLARRLARVADALVLLGELPRAGAVLAIHSEQRLELSRPPGIEGLSAAELPAALPPELRAGALLRVGPAGERAVPFANLAAGDEHPSFVGRGGLGADFGRRGLKALAVLAEPIEQVESLSLRDALITSPRLAARAAEGGLELLELSALRRELVGPEGAWSLEQGAEFGRQGRAARGQRHGCHGCPTPCGWVFERPGGGAGGGRFSALQPLGPALGLARFEDAGALLDACDRAGLDAREVGAVLALDARRGEPSRDVRALLRTIAEIASGTGEGARLAVGSAALRRELGLAQEQDEAARAPASLSLAVELGQAVSARGPDPMRSFPFLLEGPAGRAHLERALGALPAGAEDPASPAAKGRIVWWHENLAAALDACGFCAFSAAGLLADGVVDLDQLAEWVSPASLRAPLAPAGAAPEAARGLSAAGLEHGSPGARLLALGATLCALFHDANPERLADWERLPERLRQPGLLPEYRAWRGLSEQGELGARARESLAQLSILELAPPELALDPPARRASPEPLARARGEVVLRGHGPLRERLGSELRLERELPMSLLELLQSVPFERETQRAWILRGDEVLPSVYRDGQRITREVLIHAGDRLELLLAVAGG